MAEGFSNVSAGEAVPLGQAGTGRAVIFDPMKTTALEEVQKQQLQKKQEDLLKQKQQQALKEKLANFDLKLDTEFYKDSDYLTAQKDAAITAISDMISKGYDPFTPGQPGYKEGQAIINNLGKQHRKSNQQKTYAEETFKYVREHFDELDPKQVEEFYNWVNLEPEERWKADPPTIDSMFDIRAYEEKGMDTYAQASTEAGSYLDEDKEFMTTWTNEKLPTDKLMEAAVVSYDGSPRYKKEIDNMYEGLNEDQKESLFQQTDKFNQKRKAAGLQPVTPQQMIAANRFATAAYEKKSVKKSTTPYASAGAEWANKKDVNQYLLNQFGAMATGDWSGYQSLEDALSGAGINIGSLEGTEWGNRFKVDANPADYAIRLLQDEEGKTIGKEQIEGIVYDSKTGKVGFLTTTDVQGFEPTGTGVTGLYNNIEWHDPKSVFGNVVTKVNEYQDIYDQEPQLKMLVEAGAINERGDVDWEKYQNWAREQGGKGVMSGGGTTSSGKSQKQSGVAGNNTVGVKPEL